MQQIMSPIHADRDTHHIRRGEKNHETNVRMLGKQWYYAMKQLVRDKKTLRLSEEFENAARADRDTRKFDFSPKANA